jgi:hypothetical protein
MHVSATCRIAACGLVALLGADATAHAQRFSAVGREAVATAPGLEVVTVRDATLNACYTLFLFEPASQPSRVVIPDSRSRQDLAEERDRRLAALLAEHERSLYAPVPGFVADPLPYRVEIERVQSEFERTLREQELSRLEEQLARATAAPRMAVSGPAPCSPAAAAAKRP